MRTYWWFLGGGFGAGMKNIHDKLHRSFGLLDDEVGMVSLLKNTTYNYTITKGRIKCLFIAVTRVPVSQYY